jgi:menaquinone-specific isochorismate synthase
MTTSLSPDARPQFVAHSEPIADPGDLLAHLGAGGFAWLDGRSGFVTAGVAARLAAADARAVLDGMRHVRHDDAPASAGPRVVGALPFEGDGELLLPARIVARDPDGRAWSTTIDGAEIPPALHVTHNRPAQFSVRRRTEPDAWRGMIEQTLAAIDRGEVEKVVLARDVEVVADAPFDITEVLDSLRANQPGCTVYAADGFVGASPEVLLQRHGTEVVSRPMAGTGVDPAALLASQKDAHEHRVVVDAIAGALEPVCADVTRDGPAAVRFANVTHLATTIRGRLTDRDVTALDLVDRLHPTPAIGGWPAEPARRMIGELEGRARGRYAGACGWMDARGDGDFVVSLRCAEIDGAHARCFAGAGIVTGSEPGSEWAETQAKLQPMLGALVRP